jgi:MFS family permease
LRAWLLTAGLTYGGVNVVILGHPPFAAFCLLWVIWGLAYGPEEVITGLIFAQAVPDSMRGRAYSVVGVVMSTASIIGYLAGGELTAHIGATQTMAIAGYVFIVASAWSFGFSALAREIPRLDDHRPARLTPEASALDEHEPNDEQGSAQWRRDER